MSELIIILLFPIIFFIIFNENIIFQTVQKNYKINITGIDSSLLIFFSFLNILLIFSIIDLSIHYVSMFIIFYLIINVFLFFFKFKNFLNLKKYAFFTLLFYIFSLTIVSNPDLGWDAKFHWYKRALNFYQDMGLQNLSTLPKYEYPHFGTYLWGLVWNLSPLKYEYFGRLFYLLIYLFSLSSICELIANKKIRPLIFVVLAICCFNLNHFLGNQDILIFSLVVFLARYLFIIFEEKKQTLTYFLIIFLISNLLIWIKYESIVSILIIYSGIIFFKLIHKDYRYLNFVIISFLSIFFLKLFISHLYKINLDASFQFSGNYDFNLLFSYKVFFYKFIYILNYFIFSLFKNPIILISLILLSLLYLKKIKISLPNIIIFLLLNLSTFAIFYIIQNDFKWHIVNGIDRYMLQYSGFSIMYVIIFINKFIKN